jgi:hypothetical protein
MKNYIGIKWIQAEPQLEGYKVVYENGYESWSPKDVFEKAYQPTDSLKFGLAIEALKRGRKVARSGWNGKGMFLIYIPNWRSITNNAIILNVESSTIENCEFIAMKTADNKLVPWLASQTDMLAEDWVILD